MRRNKNSRKIRQGKARQGKATARQLQGKATRRRQQQQLPQQSSLKRTHRQDGKRRLFKNKGKQPYRFDTLRNNTASIVEWMSRSRCLSLLFCFCSFSFLCFWHGGACSLPPRVLFCFLVPQLVVARLACVHHIRPIVIVKGWEVSLSNQLDIETFSHM